MKRLIVSILFFSLLVFLVFLGNNQAKIKNTQIKSELINNKIKFIHLSDLHGAVMENSFFSLKQTIKKLDPDLVFLTGDIIDNDEIKSLGYVDYLKSLVGNTKTYWVSGNHEGKYYTFYQNFKDKMNALGLINIDDSFRLINIKNEQIYVAGLQDPNLIQNYSDSISKQMIKKLDKPTNSFKLLLTHRPTFIEDLVDSDFDLILAGHTHGGVVKIPFTNIGLFSNGQGFFPKYVSGFYYDKIYVNAGLGNSNYLFRLFNKPEIAFFVLE